jgi:predicted P-loop ATPase
VGEQEAAAWKARPWTDQDDRLWTEWLQKNNIDVGISVAAEAIQAAAREHPIHPIRNYLTALKWDRQPRIHEWLHTIMGADNTPYHSAIGAKYLISGVARIMTPGCKADSLLQLEGRQGIGKGTALEILAVKSQWFSDEIRDVGGREAAMGLAGRWIVEFSELAALSGKSWESQKAFISRTVDRYRPPWGRGVGDFPRQCIFASTTNRFETLGDTTGNRRFWPVRCHFVDREILRANRDQLWAEAKARFDSGEKWWLDSPDLVALAEEAQEERFEEDVNEDAIARFLEKREHVSIAEIMDLVLEIDPAQSSRGDQKRIADVLRHLGWERVQLRAEDGTKKRVFRRCK